MSTSSQLAGRVALITGAARGQGAVEAQMFAREGASVVVADVLVDQAREVASTIGSAAIAVELDVTSEASWKEGVRATLDRFGGVDVLVNNAAIHRECLLVDERPEDLDRLMAVNVRGPLLGIQAVVPSMRERRGGAIVNVSSKAGVRAYANLGTYGMTKWAVRGLTRTAAIELAEDRIRVNCVLPGAIDSPMYGFYGVKDRPSPNNLRGAVGTPEEIAEAVLFLASDRSSYINGTDLVVDGGETSTR